MCKHKRCEISSLLYDRFLILRAGTNDRAIYYRNGLRQPAPGTTVQGREANLMSIRFTQGERDVRYSYVSQNGCCTQSSEQQTPASLINMPGSARRETLAATHMGRCFKRFELILSA